MNGFVSRPPLRLWPRLALIGLVRFYRFFLSPWLGNACRFEPTCSVYALHALRLHGAATGSALTTYRLLRCHPWCAGGHDPVPDTAPRFNFFRWPRPSHPVGVLARPSPRHPASHIASTDKTITLP